MAADVGLQEGAAGVLRVLHVIATLGPVSTRTTSRRTGIPVPVVAAVCNELRARDVLGKDRPAQLTPLGRALLGGAATHDPASVCPTCHGHEVSIPPALYDVVDELARIGADAPGADVTLDQSHCTAETKVRRALYLLGVIARGPVLFIGDDDLTSIALVKVATHVGLARIAEDLTVVDVDARVLAFLERHGVGGTLLHHDVRVPLPDALAGRFEAVFTDPPYTRAGAELFVSRAVAALRPGGTVLLCFGPKGPEDAAAVQRSLVTMGLSISALVRNFNEYVGAGVLGGVGHLYHLVATSHARPAVPGAFEGPLYTREVRDARA